MRVRSARKILSYLALFRNVLILAVSCPYPWASQAADAFRTAAVVIREPERKKEQEKRRSVSGLSLWS